MTEYKTGGIADAGVAIIIGLFVGLVAAGLVNGSNQTSKSATPKPKPAETVKAETPKPAAEVKPDNCAFWRTMYFVNIGKGIGSYYYVQWQNCEAEQ